MAVWAAIRRTIGRSEPSRRTHGDALHRAEQRLQTVVQGSHGIIYIAEPEIDGRWIYVSPQIERILGFTRDEWMADPELWAKQIHPDDREAVLAEEQGTFPLTPGRRDESEYRMLTRSGECRWMRDAATIVATEDGKLVWSGVLTDVTEQHRTLEQLEASEVRFRTVIETASDAFVSIDERGVIVEWNRKAEELFGWNREEAIGLSLTDTVIPEQYRPSHERAFEQYVRTGYGSLLGRTVELSALTRDGREFPIELSVWASPIQGELRVHGFLRDITESKALEAVTHQAFHDPLTDLPNRVLFTDRVEQALSRAATGHETIAVLILDLDDFKTVNDTLGHVAGDQLLIEVANRLRSGIRPSDTLARLSGDEFAILLEHLDNVEVARAVARRVKGALEDPVVIEDMEIFVRASVGIAIPTGAVTGSVGVISDADVALYVAKSRGKDSFEVFEPAMREAVVTRLELKADLRRALERDEFVLHFQPCVRLSDSAIVGVEALIRWKHRGRGLLPPRDFIPLAEETGLIVPVGRWALVHACATASEWLRRVPEAGPISLRVNLSPRQLQDPQFAADVGEILATHGLPPEQLVLELTESSLVEDPDDVLARLGELRRVGIRLALDDFGTGYSSLSYLQRFPIDILKVDRSFVSELGRGTDEGVMATAIVQLAHNLGMETIAEGVERPEQVTALQRLNCAHGQGYHFSPPITAPEMEELLRDQAAARRSERRLRLA
jgi:diguanylate cyclase (GGDEF)-like protein/PAS domain S-box-containing protein